MKSIALRLLSALALMVLPSTETYASNGQGFINWLSGLRKEALAEGISQFTVDIALSDIEPLPRVLELDRKQPEGTMSFAEYKKRVINQDRIDKGRKLLREHSTELDRASAMYGVPPEMIVALWGVETSYGENTGGFEIIPALATLAYNGRRSDFFRGELIKALRIADQGHIKLADMKGSWAGAMGQNQFMPSSFQNFAVDGNGDGKRDIWHSLPDVFASTANYLSKNGWKQSEKWGRAVKLPENFPESLTGKDKKRPVMEWKGMGVTLPDGSALPSKPGMQASLIMPGGMGGPAYLVYDNYRVIMAWNRSLYFATSVGILSDLIAKQVNE